MLCVRLNPGSHWPSLAPCADFAALEPSRDLVPELIQNENALQSPEKDLQILLRRRGGMFIVSKVIIAETLVHSP